MIRTACMALFGSVVGFSVVGCSSLATPPGQSAVTAQASASAHSQLSPLQGRWSGPLWGGTFVATYHAASEYGMLSHAELTTNGAVSFFEFERFQLVDGVLHMQPYPMGQPEMTFALLDSATRPGFLVFENIANDFPTRISYDTTQVGVLTILLTDPHRGSTEVETIRLEHVAQP